MATFEQVLLVKNEVFVYIVPPRQSAAAGLRAADWPLSKPSKVCRLRIIAKIFESVSDGSQDTCSLRLEDKQSGEVFAECPVDRYPGGVSIEPTADSSRYFLIRLFEPKGSRTAYVGIGFNDRSDAFDFNVALQRLYKRWRAIQSFVRALQDFFKKASIVISDDTVESSVDFSLKTGETIRLKLNPSSAPHHKAPRDQIPLVHSEEPGFVPRIPPPPPSNSKRRH